MARLVDSGYTWYNSTHLAGALSSVTVADGTLLRGMMMVEAKTGTCCLVPIRRPLKNEGLLPSYIQSHHHRCPGQSKSTFASPHHLTTSLSASVVWVVYVAPKLLHGCRNAPVRTGLQDPWPTVESCSHTRFSVQRTSNFLRCVHNVARPRSKALLPAPTRNDQLIPIMVLKATAARHVSLFSSRYQANGWVGFWAAQHKCVRIASYGPASIPVISIASSCTSLSACPHAYYLHCTLNDLHVL